MTVKQVVEVEMMESKLHKTQFVFWVSHTLKCLSFHFEPQFERIDFAGHSEMWQAVHKLVEKGYVVQ